MADLYISWYEDRGLVGCQDHFLILCGASKGFIKAFIKPFVAPQRSVKIKLNF